eukprot:10203959-Lingulodinium_polyedra.AAC.1
MPDPKAHLAPTLSSKESRGGGGGRCRRKRDGCGHAVRRCTSLKGAASPALDLNSEPSFRLPIKPIPSVQLWPATRQE